MTDLSNRKPILCLDFDGVCHSYSSGWKGADNIPDPPVPGLFDFLRDVFNDFEINIFSSRSNQVGGLEAMRAWFLKHWEEFYEARELSDNPAASAKYRVEELRFPTDKPPAAITLDDRGWLFRGVWPTLVQLKAFRPWYLAPSATCGQPERDASLLEAIENPSTIFYGPHPCDLCGEGRIVRGSAEQGFGDIRLDYPIKGWIYPNHNWTVHRCTPKPVSPS